MLNPEGPYGCQSCGACCVEAGKVEIKQGDNVPVELTTAPDNSGKSYVAKHMGGRCKALTGVIGQCVGCSIYESRPQVCRQYQPGSEGCLNSRGRALYATKSSSQRRGYGMNWEETV